MMRQINKSADTLKVYPFFLKLRVFQLALFIMFVTLAMITQDPQRAYADSALYVLDQMATGSFVYVFSGSDLNAESPPISIPQAEPITIAAGVNPSNGHTILKVVGLDSNKRSVLSTFDNGGLSSGESGSILTHSGSTLVNPVSSAYVVSAGVVNNLVRLDSLSTDFVPPPPPIRSRRLQRGPLPYSPSSITSALMIFVTHFLKSSNCRVGTDCSM